MEAFSDRRLVWEAISSIDNVLTHRIFALPIFVGIMLLVFYLTFEVIGAFLSDLLAMGIKALAGVTDAALTAYGINPVVHSLVIDGLFGGVGNVVEFLPVIVVLFFFLSMLEDTGLYGARRVRDGQAPAPDRPVRQKRSCRCSSASAARSRRVMATRTLHERS